MKSNAVLRIAFSIVLLAGAGSSVLAYSLYRNNQDQQIRLGDLNRQLDTLLAELDQGIATRQGLERQIKSLQDEQSNATAQMHELTAQLEATQQLIDPDYVAVEQNIRTELTAQFRAREQRLQEEIRSPVQDSSVASLINQLNGLDEGERMAVMSVQSRYSEFLDRLEASPERRELITQALVDLALEQAQAREDLVSQQDLNPREVRRELAALSNPDAVGEQLAYYLTEDELALLAETQSQQPTFGFRVNRNGDNSTIFLQGESVNRAEILNGGGDVFFQPFSGGREGRIAIRRLPDDN